MFVIKQTEGPINRLQFCLYLALQLQDIPDDESDESGYDEDIIKQCKSNQQLVESFPELFPFHDDDSESIS